MYKYSASVLIAGSAAKIDTISQNVTNFTRVHRCHKDTGYDIILVYNSQFVYVMVLPLSYRPYLTSIAPCPTDTKNGTVNLQTPV